MHIVIASGTIITHYYCPLQPAHAAFLVVVLERKRIAMELKNTSCHRQNRVTFNTSFQFTFRVHLYEKIHKHSQQIVPSLPDATQRLWYAEHVRTAHRDGQSHRASCVERVGKHLAARRARLTIARWNQPVRCLR